jgi:hypothetical protein
MDENVTAVSAEQTPVSAIEPQLPNTEPKDEPIDLDAPVEPPQETSPEAELQTEADGDNLPAGPEFVEVEINGKKYAVPPDLKDGYMMQADYTRKTQEVSELRKAAEARAAEAETAYTTSQEVLEARAHLINLDAGLKRFEGLDWRQFEADDPVGAMSAWREYQQLREARSNLGTQIDQHQRQVSEKAEQETAIRLRETREFAEKNIAGWTPEMDVKIANFAQGELGFAPEALRGAINPSIYKTLHLAMLGHQLLTRTQTAPKPQPQTNPLRTVTAKSAATTTKDPSEMSMAEYAAWSDRKFSRK